MEIGYEAVDYVTGRRTKYYIARRRSGGGFVIVAEFQSAHERDKFIAAAVAFMPTSKNSTGG